MRFGSLFAGIGGFDLGLERAGMECAWQVEIDPFCLKVLEKHWPNVRRYTDVREVHGVLAHSETSEWWGLSQELERRGIAEIGGSSCRNEREAPQDCPSCLPAVDLICGGFPCQPFSVAGKQRGKEDDRHLWPEMFRIVSELRPTWVVGENVPGLVRLGLDEVLSDLEGIGYSCQTFDIPACAVDAPHVRHRIWIVGHATKLHGDGSEHNGRSDRESGREIPESGNTGCHEDVADADIQGPQGRDERGERIGEWTLGPGSWPNEGEWFAESGICRVSHGVRQRVDRLRSLGNAVVPQVVEIIGRAIMEGYK